MGGCKRWLALASTLAAFLHSDAFELCCSGGGAERGQNPRKSVVCDHLLTCKIFYLHQNLFFLSQSRAQPQRASVTPPVND